MSHQNILAEELGHEDIARGDYVQTLYELHEIWPIWVLIDCPWAELKPVRVAAIPAGEQTPMKVLEVCLPFIVVKTVSGARETIDVRRRRLARVSRRYARKLFRQANAERDRRRPTNAARAERRPR